jgi:PIN domain nuclease of toxin-antitoxin system
MDVLLDTQLVVWWHLAHPRLTPAIRERIEKADTVFISQVSLWELAIKVSSGKLHFDLPQFCRRTPEEGFRWLALRESHILASAQLPFPSDHRDPFDRMLVAQALTEPLILLTTDRDLAAYGPTIHVLI